MLEIFQRFSDKVNVKGLFMLKYMPLLLEIGHARSSVSVRISTISW